MGSGVGSNPTGGAFLILSGGFYALFKRFWVFYRCSCVLGSGSFGASGSFGVIFWLDLSGRFW